MYQKNVKAKLIDDNNRTDFQKKMNEFLNSNIIVEDIQYRTGQSGSGTRFTALIIYYDNTDTDQK